MQAGNIKLGIGTYFGIFVFLVLFLMIFFKQNIFDFIVEFSGSNALEESQQATQETTNLLLSLDKIKLDVNVLQSTYLQALTAFPTFPIDAQTLSNFGKSNPFLGGTFTVVQTTATSSVGAVVYSNNRAGNNGNSLRPVNQNTLAPRNR